eukprot:COSAG04_NODE_348_length_16121_cov_7.375172_18_plen_191_part_00
MVAALAAGSLVLHQQADDAVLPLGLRVGESGAAVGADRVQVDVGGAAQDRSDDRLAAEDRPVHERRQPPRPGPAGVRPRLQQHLRHAVVPEPHRQQQRRRAVERRVRAVDLAADARRQPRRDRRAAPRLDQLVQRQRGRHALVLLRRRAGEAAVGWGDSNRGEVGQGEGEGRAPWPQGRAAATGKAWTGG